MSSSKFSHNKLDDILIISVVLRQKADSLFSIEDCKGTPFVLLCDLNKKRQWSTTEPYSVLKELLKFVIYYLSKGKWLIIRKKSYTFYSSQGPSVICPYWGTTWEGSSKKYKNKKYFITFVCHPGYDIKTIKLVN